MGSRRKSREVALQVLYLLEYQTTDIEEAIAHFWREDELDSKTVQFTRELVEGTRGNVEKLDEYIDKSSEHWRLDRMALIDINVMRLAVYEFLYTPQTPRKVVINEALEIAKRFSSEESTQFVNGILDNVRKLLEEEESQS
jgi:N utilization substance protein B